MAPSRRVPARHRAPRAWRRLRALSVSTALLFTAGLGAVLVEGAVVAGPGTRASAVEAPLAPVRPDGEQQPTSATSRTRTPDGPAAVPTALSSPAAPSPVDVSASHPDMPPSSAPAASTTASIPGPQGVTGQWRLSFDDEFSGTSLDPSRWSVMEGASMNNVTAHAGNVAVRDGYLWLTLASSTSGAYVSSAPFDIGGGNGYLLPVGSYAEARVRFPGNGTTIYNWPAWWTGSGPAWPAGGEHDIAEGLGTLTVNYHDARGGHNQAPIPGNWSNDFHVYGIYRAADHADVYWDGRPVASYPTGDNGAGQALLLNVGVNSPNGSMSAFGAASQVRVDYVRAWRAMR